MKKEIINKNVRLVLPEGEDERVLLAARKLADDNLVKPILVGKHAEILKTAEVLKINIADLELVDPISDSRYNNFVDEFVTIRNGKHTKEQALELMKDPTYYGTMMVKQGEADALLSGAIHSTADTIRPALQIVKTKPGTKIVSSMFYMYNEENSYIFGDCALNINPTSEQLVDIAEGCNQIAPLFSINNPKTAFLSFSTKGSAASEEVTKVSDAAKLFAEKFPNTASDGELQLDAAIVPSVGSQKAPGSKVAGSANILIFPDLNSGNIGYKLAQRLGKYEAIGPILLGLNAPINDLSRGCDSNDVYETAIITAYQSLLK
jgi:phosphate acetyltransferase